MKNSVVNTRQETETGLRQLSGLEMDLVNAEINEQAIIELESYINSGDYFVETALQVGFVDLLLTELIKKLKIMSDDKQDLLIKYEEGSDQIKAVNYKIEEIKIYILEAIASNKREAITKRKKLEEKRDVLSKKFEGIPSREKNLQVLEREFALQESVYNFLSQKRIEAFIASTSTTSFHRIIQPAYVPKLPASPNKTLITFVCGLLGLIMGIVFVYLRQFARAKVLDKSDLERNSQIPVAGIIREMKSDIETEYLTLSKSLLLKKMIAPNQVIVVSSSLSREGKTESVQNLGNALMTLGYKVCFIDFDNTHHDLSSAFNGVKLFTEVTGKDFTENGLVLPTKRESNLLEENYALIDTQLAALKLSYDFVIIDTSPTAISITPIQLMKLANFNLYAVKVNFTPLSHLSNADLLKDEYEIENIQFLLTNANKASNYSGNLIGSRFGVKAKTKVKRKGIIYKIEQYINYYL
jgi:cellulose biosynthesis protein BcsQ